MTSKLTVVVVEEDRDRALAIVDALKDSCDCDLFVIGTTSGLARRIAAHAPDVVLIDVDNPTRDMLEELTLASGPLERPVAMFVSRAAGGLAQAAIEAGVSAYVVDGLKPERLLPVLEVTIARFRMFRQMRIELAETRRALEERKVIDRAKGLLMKAKGIDEDAAYALLRRTAMDQGRRVAEVAEALVTASGLLR
ncbi:ANTAR domain-containing response regulator [Salipiger marinus]|jgi:response regulator NasT|uniref:Response regulator receiver and ANTAR domain protein n=1 Tax=Salipiger marinus TaxID=555512 RepID=A0A1G8QC02_9RHOB|nr:MULTISPECIES: ANTAR domain-containing protein [Salipiger]MCD1617930.1 ANTAR domain-containing protein [Salipiger manganoxidans]MEB3418607.1 ANTAR domain-containing protein [Salipiger manganoxidans]SDJ02128.1 response regulator receiver and ANTAR domain protein [Salipiger marinus]